jgi:hypothetical protein
MIVGVTGLIGSGKDTIANYLTTFHGFKKVSFAGSLKDAVAAVFNWDRELLEGTTSTSREWREQVDPWWAKRLDMPHLTPRWILQYWGTEVCRKGFHNDVWVASLENRILNSKDNIVVTDCRFANEVKALKNAGAITVRVHRGTEPEWVALAKTNIDEFLSKYPDIHASEYSSVGLNYDFHIDNNGTIDDLHKSIENIINPPLDRHVSN